MSDPLNAYQPPTTKSMRAPKPRPTSITVLGILNIVFGAMGVLGMCFATLPFWLLASNGPSMPPNPVLDIMRESQGYRIFLIVSIALGIVAAIALLSAGIGLLKMRPWGRQLSIVYGVYAIFSAIAGVVANSVWVFGPLMQKAAGSSGPEAAGAMGGMLGGTVGGCFGLIYPIVLLVFMFRPNVVESLRSNSVEERSSPRP